MIETMAKETRSLINFHAATLGADYYLTIPQIQPENKSYHISGYLIVLVYHVSKAR